MNLWEDLPEYIQEAWRSAIIAAASALRTPPAGEDHTCHDCGVKQGELHDLGCDMERCAHCGRQWISCGCKNKVEKPRVPYILYPNLCARCGILWPEMFHVSTTEWNKYVMICERDKMLCRVCYDWIKVAIDAATPP